MATVTKRTAKQRPILELQTGDRMTQQEFHRIYEKMPPHFKAELIGGIVYVASPLKLQHGTNHLPLGSLLLHYEEETPGTQSGDNATILLGKEGEPQPDLFLRILPEYGGQSKTSPQDYVAGAPELIAEIANSSRSIDLHAKRDDYARYGVQEYLVASLREKKLFWFDLRNDQELKADSDGVFRLRTFPGLWINQEALWSRKFRRLHATLDQGLATPEHAAFVQRLAARTKTTRTPKPNK